MSQRGSARLLATAVTKALLMGYTYPDLVSIRPLPEVADGIARLEQTLQLPLQEVQVSFDASRAETLERIEGFLQQPREPQDALLLYLSGHGSVDQNGDLTLLVSQPSRGGRAPAGVGFRELNALLKSVERLLLVIDTSNAGIAAEKYEWSQTTVLLCSTGARDNALARSDFTLSLAAGIGEGAADLDGDGLIDAGELFRFVTDRMASTGVDQRPLLSAPFDPAAFVVARNPRPPLRPLAAKQRPAERLPPLVDPFVGREAELAQLTNLLSERPAGPVALSGLLGMGKTQLSLHAADGLRQRYPGGVLYASTREGLDVALGAFASALGHRGDESFGPILDSLAERTRGRAVLFILDDVGDGPDTEDQDRYIRWWRVLADQCGLLLIGRRQLDFPDVRTVTLDPLDRASGEDLVRRLADATGKAPNASLVSQIGEENNPLNLRLAASSPAAANLESVSEPADDAVGRSYEGLPERAASLFRRATLAGAQALDPEIADRLVPGAAEANAIETLVAASLFIVLPDGRVDYLSDTVRALASDLLRREEGAEAIERMQADLERWFLVNRRYPPEPRIERDYWTTIDQLNFTPYADAIAAFVKHPSTLPPLTIGIKAPWGAGKTSLMRMVQDRLDPVGENGARTTIRLTELSRQKLRFRRGLRRRTATPDAEAAVTNREVLDRTEQSTGRKGEPPTLHTRPELPPGTAPGWRPTVWFNPWIYQSGQEVWAGMAYEIIHQIVDRLPVGDRERFWLELNLARVDKDAVRRRLYRAAWERLVPFVVVFGVATLLALLVVIAGQLVESPWLSGLGGLIGGSGFVTILAAVASFFKFFGRAAAGPVASLISSPDLVKSSQTALTSQFAETFDAVVADPGYDRKLGFLHLVQTDMQRVLGLVAREDQPVVIFVDDLDRCSPGTVAQVIEAINLFLAGEFPNCIFLLAMEPALVAAHVEVIYKDLAEVLDREGSVSDSSSLGWRFLEKIVQLPLSLPSPTVSGNLDRYVTSLLTTPDGSSDDGYSGVGDLAAPASAETTSPDPRTMMLPSDPVPISPQASPSARLRIDAALVNRIEAAIRERRPNVATLPEVARRVQTEMLPESAAGPMLTETTQAVDRIFAGLYSDADALTAIEAALPALSSSNPREIKRYINLFRFYTFIVQRQRLDGLAAPPSDCIAKVAALAIRWPQLLSSLGHPYPAKPGESDGASTLIAALEHAARSDNDSASRWDGVLAVAGLLAPQTDGSPATHPEWSARLSAFLASGPPIGHLAARLL